ncbi:MAG: hypothetical protein R8G66_09700 [Cytophagales bacterium]|nr:hypothetical protein [Cytophagales bacterium]
MNTSTPHKYLKVIGILAIMCIFQPLASHATRSNSAPKTNEHIQKRIYLALLLDTSNSMDGLIDQAKSQLWNIVDELANAEHGGTEAELNISLYEYGNDNLSVRSGYVRQITKFTTDLDDISAQLFALKTNGGSEYCGTVIKRSLTDLDWGNDPEDLKLVFIAGNEPFDQGSISFEQQCVLAQQSNIQVNTIFCGPYNQGISGLWKKGANLGGGSYLNIDMDQKTVYVATPYDASIDSLNNLLNDTYIAYGVRGRQKKAQQLQEDSNAESYSSANKVRRAISKSKHVYKNATWDLVDALDEEEVDLSSLEDSELPEEMTGMTVKEKETYIQHKKQSRTVYQKQIQELGSKRSRYIKAYNDNLSVENPLEVAILQSVKQAAKEKQFTFKE